MKKTLSKSDFKVALSCPMKLIYKKKYYPNNLDSNEYMKLLSQGGYVIGKMATLLYPDGIEPRNDTADDLAMTTYYLNHENITLFEAAIQSEQKLARIDILEKHGNSLHLIEVKSKSFNPEEPMTESEFGDYFDDVAYQYLILKELYPEADIRCSLLMPDKSKRTEIENLASWFTVYGLNYQSYPGEFHKPVVVFEYDGDPNEEEYLRRLQNEGILGLVDVTDKVTARLDIIRNKAQLFLRILNDGIDRTDYSLCVKCRDCEFNDEKKIPNGFKECWGDMAVTEPHILELYRAGQARSIDGLIVNNLIAKGKSSLFDVDPNILATAKGEVGSIARRQKTQIDNMREHREWKSPELESFVQGLEYPLHFIDFETYGGAVPLHKGMRAYEIIPTQWSCHTIQHPGATPTHAEWLHTGEQFPDPDAFPGFEFARSLMKQIGTTGTVLIWSHYENTVLNSILNQMDQFGNEDDNLRNWLLGITSLKVGNKLLRSGRMVDMCDMALKYYFHPMMKGRVSIKKVLPAIWTSFPYLHEVPHFMDYAPAKLEEVLDPYDMLTLGVQYDEENDDGVIKEGTAAMRAYYRLRLDKEMSQEQKDEIRRRLLAYCKLDTMAMVIIARHWGLY